MLPERTNRRRRREKVVVGVLAVWFCQAAFAQEVPSLPRDRYRNGEQTLRAFASVSAATRSSIIKLNVDGETVALGCVVDANGLALTKASELKKGKLTCWVAAEKEVP